MGKSSTYQLLQLMPEAREAGRLAAILDEIDACSFVLRSDRVAPGDFEALPPPDHVWTLDGADNIQVFASGPPDEPGWSRAGQASDDDVRAEMQRRGWRVSW